MGERLTSFTVFTANIAYPFLKKILVQNINNVLQTGIKFALAIGNTTSMKTWLGARFHDKVSVIYIFLLFSCISIMS